jgi:hypothetical protein
VQPAPYKTARPEPCAPCHSCAPSLPVRRRRPCWRPSRPLPGSPPPSLDSLSRGEPGQSIAVTMSLHSFSSTPGHRSAPSL